MKLKKLLESSMRKIEVVEYYKDVQDKIKKFDTVEKGGKVVLMVVEK